LFIDVILVKKVLFIHHGGSNGGAPLSLLYTAKGIMNYGYTPVIGLCNPSKKLHDLYNSNGIETVDCPEIKTWHFSTVGYRPWYSYYTWRNLWEVAYFWKRTESATLELVDKIQPVFVHLNGQPLVASANALNKKKFPFIWHFREPAQKSKGFRYSIIKDIIDKTEHLIFLSKADQRSWIGREERGRVIANFIDFKQFDLESYNKSEIRKEMNISNEAKVLIYVGSRNRVKGFEALMKALSNLRNKYNIVCLMPGAKEIPAPSGYLAKVAWKLLPLIGFKKDFQVFEELLDFYELRNNCVLLDFTPDIVRYFVASDILVFPAARPHFARPIIEASALQIPAVAPDFLGFEELVVNGETGLLYKAGDDKALESSIEHLLRSDNLVDFGVNGQNFARENFEYNTQIKKIINLYDKVLQTNGQ
jgi:glycosyltransferase involved in cell wall biosynthesis